MVHFNIVRWPLLKPEGITFIYFITYKVKGIILITYYDLRKKSIVLFFYYLLSNVENDSLQFTPIENVPLFEMAHEKKTRRSIFLKQINTCWCKWHLVKKRCLLLYCIFRKPKSASLIPTSSCCVIYITLIEIFEVMSNF